MIAPTPLTSPWPSFIFGGVQYAPGNISYMTPVIYVALIFHVYIRRRARDWWAKVSSATAFIARC